MLKKQTGYKELDESEIMYDGGTELTRGQIAAIAAGCVLVAAGIGFGTYKFFKGRAAAKLPEGDFLTVRAGSCDMSKLGKNFKLHDAYMKNGQIYEVWKVTPSPEDLAKF